MRSWLRYGVRVVLAFCFRFAHILLLGCFWLGVVFGTFSQGVLCQVESPLRHVAFFRMERREAGWGTWKIRNTSVRISLKTGSFWGCGYSSLSKIIGKRVEFALRAITIRENNYTFAF